MTDTRNLVPLPETIKREVRKTLRFFLMCVAVVALVYFAKELIVGIVGALT